MNTFRLIFKSKFLWLSLFLLLFILGGSYLSAQFSGRQSLVVAVDVAFSLIRVCYPIVLFLLIQEVFLNDFFRKFYLKSLTFPTSRVSWVLRRFGAVFVFLSFVLLAFFVGVKGLVFMLEADSAHHSVPELGWGYWVAVFFVLVEAFVLSTLCVFLSLVASAASFVLIGFLGFVVIGRSFGAIFQLLQNNSSAVLDAESYSSAISMMFYLVPDLGALDVRIIALYGNISLLPVEWVWSLASCLIFAFSVLALSVWLFNRKRFN